MKNIPIYSAEKSIATEILSKHSIACCSIVESSTFTDLLLKSPKIKAEYTDNDLYFYQSILVSTVANRNDDVFLPIEVWKAKDTPSHKPTNLEHHETKIVGHMIDNFVIDIDGNLISNKITIDELPKSFHILVNAVIYKTWEDEEQKKVISELLEKMESGQMFCSMECRLSDFDYMMINSNNSDEQKIIARNEQTAFLTKYLRCYGGDGEYNGYKLGRVLRDIAFSGKGLTEKPANPDSIIFTKNDLFDFSKAQLFNDNNILNENGVLLFSEDNGAKGTTQIINSENKMSDVYKEQAEKLEGQNKVLAAELEKLKQELAKSDVEKHQKAMAKLEAELDAIKAELSAREKSVSAAEDKVSDLEKVVADLEKVKSELENKIEKVEKENIKASRVAMLVKGGVDEAKAIEKVALYESLDDKQFKSIADDIVAAVKKVETKTIIVDADTDEDEVADAADVDKTEVKDDATLSVDANVQEVKEQETLKALASNLSSRMKYKNKENK